MIKKLSFLVIFVCPTLAARAAILQTDAHLAASVQEFINGQPGSSSSDTAVHDPTNETLPILASANVVSTDLGGAVQALGQSFSAFADPTRLDQPDPEELALEAACYSNSTDFAYTVAASAEETRTIVFASPGSTVAPSEIQFQSDGTRLIQSTLFLNGAVLLWSNESAADLSALTANLVISIWREDFTSPLFGSSTLPAPIFSGSLNVDGSGSTSSVVAKVLVTQEATVDDLAALGVSDAAIEKLRTLAETGTLRIIILPPQQHTYNYRVTADEQFHLVALLDLRLHAIPGGTGVTATFGRPFQELADFIDQAIPGVNGKSLQSSLNKLVDARDVIQVPPPNSQTPFGSMCGALGMESFLLAGLFLAFCVRRA